MEEPRAIKKLPESVINRIAAGEIIQRPANVVKELIENALDAQATQISVLVKSGGLKRLEIQDNGKGIIKEDLNLLCERFATSKLREYDDLLSIASYGFRGEALASISHVARLTVTTKTDKTQCAYRAEYSDGKLKSAPKPCAGNQGTVFLVDDLFFNEELRRSTLKSPADEYRKIQSVMAKYAIHNPTVGFSLKKHGENNMDLKTPPLSSTAENIGIVHGNAVRKELLPFGCEDAVLEYKAVGSLSNPNFPVKKPVFILFINHRLVECPELKRAVESTYLGYLPKGSHPFVYLSIEIPAKRIDVNVHPAKQQVAFLNESEIIAQISENVEGKLLACNESRTYSTQSALPTIPSLRPSTGATGDVRINSPKRISLDVEAAQSMKASKLSSQDPRPYDKELVRTDPKLQRLDPFLFHSQNAEQSPEPESFSVVQRQESTGNFGSKPGRSDARIQASLSGPKRGFEPLLKKKAEAGRQKEIPVEIIVEEENVEGSFDWLAIEQEQDPRRYDKELVRTGAKLQRLDAFLYHSRNSEEGPKPESSSAVQRRESTENYGSGHGCSAKRGFEPPLKKKPGEGRQKELPEDMIVEEENVEGSDSLTIEQEQDPRPYDKVLVRTDAKLQRLDSFLYHSQNAEQNPEPESSSAVQSRQSTEKYGSGHGCSAKRGFEPPSKKKKPEAGRQEELPEDMIVEEESVEASDSLTMEQEVELFHEEDSRESGKFWRDIKLDSVERLRSRVVSEASVPLRELMKKHSYVGCVDAGRVLVQFQTDLYLLDVQKLSEELYYQAILFRFGNLGSIVLSEPAPILDLLSISGAELNERSAMLSAETLSSKAAMLKDYFSLEIKDGAIVAVPGILSEHVPQLESLPRLAKDLILDVDWSNEEACFDGVSRALGRFSAVKTDYCSGSQYSGLREDELEWKNVVEHLVLPSLKAKLMPPAASIQNKAVIKVTDLQTLYKVFERC